MIVLSNDTDGDEVDVLIVILFLQDVEQFAYHWQVTRSHNTSLFED